jgi:hypothetical protein
MFLLTLFWTLTEALAYYQPQTVKRQVISPVAKFALNLEFLDSDLIYFSIQASSKSSTFISPHVDPAFEIEQIYLIDHAPNHFQTSSLEIVVDPVTLTISIYDVSQTETRLHTIIHPWDLDSDWKGFNFERQNMAYAYGLGQQFIGEEGLYGVANQDWIGRQRVISDSFV